MRSVGRRVVVSVGRGEAPEMVGQLTLPLLVRADQFKNGSITQNVCPRSIAFSKFNIALASGSHLIRPSLSRLVGKLYAHDDQWLTLG